MNIRLIIICIAILALLVYLYFSWRRYSYLTRSTALVIGTHPLIRPPHLISKRRKNPVSGTPLIVAVIAIFASLSYLLMHPRIISQDVPTTDEYSFTPDRLSKLIMVERDAIQALWEQEIIAAGTKLGLRFQDNWQQPAVEAGPTAAGVNTALDAILAQDSRYTRLFRQRKSEPKMQQTAVTDATACEAVAALNAQRRAIELTYQRYLNKVKTFAKPPAIGPEWPRNGYSLPTTENFMRVFNQQVAAYTLVSILQKEHNMTATDSSSSPQEESQTKQPAAVPTPPREPEHPSPATTSLLALNSAPPAYKKTATPHHQAKILGSSGTVRGHLVILPRQHTQLNIRDASGKKLAAAPLLQHRAYIIMGKPPFRVDSTRWDHFQLSYQAQH